LRWPRDTLYQLKLALTSSAGCGRLVGIVRLRTKTTEFSFNLYTVGRTPWTGDQPVAKPLPTHGTTQTQNKRTQTSIPRVRFEPTIPVFRVGEDGSGPRLRRPCDQLSLRSRQIYLNLPFTALTLMFNLLQVNLWYCEANCSVYITKRIIFFVVNLLKIESLLVQI
jgi:hypothetical protein